MSHIYKLRVMLLAPKQGTGGGGGGGGGGAKCVGLHTVLVWDFLQHQYQSYQ